MVLGHGSGRGVEESLVISASLGLFERSLNDIFTVLVPKTKGWRS